MMLVKDLINWVRKDELVKSFYDGEVVDVNLLMKRIITLTKIKIERDLYKEHKKDIMLLVDKIDCWEQRFFNKHEKELDKVVKGIDQDIRY